MENVCATTTSPENSEDELFDELPSNFKWNDKFEKSFLLNMLRLKPSGINKHLSVLLIRENLSEELKLNMTNKCIWKYLNSKWDIEAADHIENISFCNNEKYFSLPEEYDQLISTELEIIKNSQEKESLNDENNKKKYFNSGKTRSKSNSMSSVDSKDGFNETVSLSLTESFTMKTSEVGSDEVSNSRRSLRTNDKHDEKDVVDDLLSKKKLLRTSNASDESNKTKDLKQSNKKLTNQIKDSEKNDSTSNVRGRKRKSRNVSESSLSSDNSKYTRSNKNNVTDMTFSDSSSRSVTPEILRGKTSNRSVTPEITSRKSNLRSGDKDQKNKSSIEKACMKYGHNVDLILPEIKIERFKLERSEKQITTSTPKQSTPSKNDTNSKIKNKTRGSRVTSDILVAQQSSDQLMSRRSCSNK